MNLRANNTELKNPQWNDIICAFDRLDGRDNGHICLESKNGDYVQCAGWREKLTVEYRLNAKPKFKHYVIGKAEGKSPLKVSWVLLQTSGGIMVHKEEVLTIDDAEFVFKEFYKNNAIPSGLNKRNVTKLHV